MFDVLQNISTVGNYRYTSDKHYINAEKHGLIKSPSELTELGERILNVGLEHNKAYYNQGKLVNFDWRDADDYQDTTMLEHDDEHGEYLRFNYISTHTQSFVYLCAELWRQFGDRKVKFIDIGCGKGFLLNQLKSFLPHNSYNGIELVEKYAHIAEEEFGLAVYNCDALKFSNYAHYDFIYLYRPIDDEKVYRKLIEKIWNDMKPGAVMCQSFAPYNPIDSAESDEYFLVLKK